MHFVHVRVARPSETFLSHHTVLRRRFHGNARVVIFCKRLRRHNKEGPDAFTSGPSRAPVQLIEKGRRQERASSVSQRIDVISLRGPECDALRGCPRFALFYMAVL